MSGGSKTKSNTSSQTTYSKTTTKNPYVTSVTDNSGTTTTLNDGTAYKSIYDYTNANMDDLLEEYRNPTLNSPTNQALLKSYTDNLNKQSLKALEYYFHITRTMINPLTQRNMVRSSAATNMYNNLTQLMNDSISDYSANLLANSQANTANMINLLMNAYLQGHNAVNGNQALSLQTSSGNAYTSGSSSSSSTSYGL